jgi:hypothetical protein
MPGLRLVILHGMARIGCTSGPCCEPVNTRMRPPAFAHKLFNSGSTAAVAAQVAVLLHGLLMVLVDTATWRSSGLHPSPGGQRRGPHGPLLFRAVDAPGQQAIWLWSVPAAARSQSKPREREHRGVGGRAAAGPVVAHGGPRNGTSKGRNLRSSCRILGSSSGFWQQYLRAGELHAPRGAGAPEFSQAAQMQILGTYALAAEAMGPRMAPLTAICWPEWARQAVRRCRDLRVRRSKPSAADDVDQPELRRNHSRRMRDAL